MNRLEDIPGWFVTLRRSHARSEALARNLNANGLGHIKRFYGIDAALTGLRTIHPHTVDDPKSLLPIDARRVGIYLSHYILWIVIREMGMPETLILEDDALFVPDWRERWEGIRLQVPEDWDIVMIGSCNCMDKPIEQAIPDTSDLFIVKYPQCTHAYIVRQKAIETLLKQLERIDAPADIAMVLHVYPYLKVYTVLPRLVDQDGTLIHP